MRSNVEDIFILHTRALAYSKKFNLPPSTFQTSNLCSLTMTTFFMKLLIRTLISTQCSQHGLKQTNNHIMEEISHMLSSLNDLFTTRKIENGLWDIELLQLEGLISYLLVSGNFFIWGCCLMFKKDAPVLRALEHSKASFIQHLKKRVLLWRCWKTTKNSLIPLKP